MITSGGTLQARLFWAFTLVTVIAIALPALFSRNTLYEDRLDLAGQQALAQISVIRGMLEAGADQQQIDALLAAVRQTGARMTVTRNDGIVVRDSHIGPDDIGAMDNHNDRPEIEAARLEGHGISLRHSNTLGIDAVYAAVALPGGEILRLAVPAADIRRGLEKEFTTLALAGVSVAALCVLLSVFITRRFRNGIDSMAEVVAAIAKDKGGRRLLKVPGREFLPLAYAVNRMAENTERYVATTTDQQTQLEVILDSVHDGILVLGPAGNIRRHNRTMRVFFPSIGDAAGKQVIEGVPVPALQRKVDELLQTPFDAATARPEEDDAIHFEREGRYLVAHISRPVERNQSLGAVIVIYDATNIMRLERVRKDFVANVSHELRTPLTAISGYAETLAGLEELDPAHRNFAEIIHKHAQAMGRVVSELLALARVEDDRQEMRLSSVDPREALNEAVRLCEPDAKAKNVRFLLKAGFTGNVTANSALLTQVFRNLLENACRYSPEGGEVAITSAIREKEAEFSILDQGPGIPEAERTRIFERLYQVKKQRNSGSSGIGLAICKHIVERHGGRIRAESPYEGFSTAMIFTLPLAAGSRGQAG